MHHRHSYRTVNVSRWLLRKLKFFVFVKRLKLCGFGDIIWVKTITASLKGDIMGDWNSNQYIKFKAERTQPSTDLIRRIDIDPRSILDVGCGPGNSTEKLSENFPLAGIVGIDSSEDMLRKAKATYPEFTFLKCDVPAELDSLEQFDMIFSNACLHWIPNHRELLPTLMQKLNDGGVLAVQMPLVQYAPFYQIIDALLLDEKWKKLRGVQNFHNLSPDETYDILSAVSSEVTMWETTYYHILSSHDDIIEWYKGSGLRTYLEKLNETERADFLAELREKLRERVPVQADGSVILKMPRLFFIAKKR